MATDLDVRPNVGAGGIPHCAYEDCPSYDGKRCRVLGQRPDGICEPAVAALVGEVAELRAKLSQAEWDIRARVHMVVASLTDPEPCDWTGRTPDEPCSSLNYLQHIRFQRWECARLRANGTILHADWCHKTHPTREETQACFEGHIRTCVQRASDNGNEVLRLETVLAAIAGLPNPGCGDYESDPAEAAVDSVAVRDARIAELTAAQARLVDFVRLRRERHEIIAREIEYRDRKQAPWAQRLRTELADFDAALTPPPADEPGAGGET